jgi:hypothetical protein
MHRLGQGPLFFGKAAANRFDDPVRKFGVLYVGLSPEAAFAETLLRDPPRQLIAESEVAVRRIARIRVRRPLRLLQAYDEGLARAGLTAEIGTCEYDRSQSWAAAFHAHPAAIDGIAWRGRHDNGTFCVAVFDRAVGKLGGAIKSSEVSEIQLKSFADRWCFGLV